ncbi:MAG: glutathione S-transferase family protein [Pseudomonadota bacterium]
MSAGYRLYGGVWTRAVGVMMVLEELGLAYESLPLDLLGGEHRRAEFLAMNPAGFVPLLITPEGQHLHEASAIMLHLAEKHDPGGLVPALDDPERGLFLSRYIYVGNDIQPPAKRFFFSRRYALRPEDTSLVHAQARAAAEERWSVLDGFLAEGDGPFHLGERFTVADIQVAYWANYGFDELDDITGAFPAVKRLFTAVSERPKSGALLAQQRETLLAWRAKRRS